MKKRHSAVESKLQNELNSALSVREFERKRRNEVIGEAKTAHNFIGVGLPRARAMSIKPEQTQAELLQKLKIAEFIKKDRKEIKLK